MTEIEVKAAVRKRDGFCCVRCGISNADHVDKTGRQLQVHRIQPGVPYRVDGCTTLCQTCHGREPKSAPWSTIARLAKNLPSGLADQVIEYAEQQIKNNRQMWEQYRKECRMETVEVVLSPSDTISERLRLLRERAGLSTSQLADLAGLSGGWMLIRRLETGTTKLSLERAILLARAMKVSLAEFDDLLLNSDVEKGNEDDA